MAVSNTLLSAGVSVTVTTQGVAPIPSPTTVPLIFLATRANKQTPDGSGIALGTVESNILRVFTSQSDLLQAYGSPVFVTSDGVPVHGDETNEYGLLTAYMMCALTNFVFVVRAPIDLGQLVSTSIAPVLPPPDGTYWINTTGVVGGIFAYNGATWTAVTFHVFTVAPGAGDGANGDWGFDYSTLNGILVFKNAGTWYPATTTNVESLAGATHPLYVQSATPVGGGAIPAPVAGDFWYKTSSSGGGTNLNVASYRASDGVWVIQPILYASAASFTGTGAGTNLTASAVTGFISPGTPISGTGVPTGTIIVSQTSGTNGGAGVYVTNNVTISAGATITAAPAPIQNQLWLDTSGLNGTTTTGFRPLNIGTGSAFITLPIFVQSFAPVSAPPTGTLWYNDSYTDFAMYMESGNIWVPIVTTLNSNPTGFQKVISDSPPQFPSVNAIWIDVGSSETNHELDNFPIVKRWNGTAWIDITNASTTYIQSIDPIASIVINGSYWINTGEALTQNIVKAYDPTFVAQTVNSFGVTVPQLGNYWAPQSGRMFGRQSQRFLVVDALQEIITSNQDIQSEVNYYQLIACPGYPETYQNISELNMEISQIALAVFDIPKFVIPSGIPSGREVTISAWITDANNVSETNELGFIGAPDPFQANAYPGGLATNPTDGQLVYVGPSHILLQCIAYNDSVAYPWYPPAGPNRGLVTSVASVGYLNDDQNYVPLNMNRGQRDICYTQRVNPIANIPNVGLVLYGQKTMAVPGIVLDRINVVRLVAKMKYDFQQLMQPFLFELNNATTQRNATIVAQRYLAGLAALNAVYDYAVLCNSSNNTPDVVAAHQLIVDVAIQPELSIEFIYVPILVLYPTQPLPF
jgi:hypothetical protein